MSRQFESPEMCIQPAKKGGFPLYGNIILFVKLIQQKVSTVSTAGCISTFTAAVEQGKESVYRRFVSEFQSIQNASVHNVKYHKTWNRSYASKQNLSSIDLGEPLLESHQNCASNDTQVNIEIWLLVNLYLLQK